MLLRISIICLCTLFLGTSFSQAYIQDKNHQCKAFCSAPQSMIDSLFFITTAECKNGYVEGEGEVIIYQMNSTKLGVYTGSFVQGKITGAGKLEVFGISAYTGEFKDGMFDGQGALDVKNKEWYFEGKFSKNNFVSGKSYFTRYAKKRESAPCYEGNFQDFSLQGKGKYYPEGTRFSNYYVEAMFNKQSIIGDATVYYMPSEYYTSGYNKYTGPVSNLKYRNGKGVLYMQNGNRYEGEFRKDSLIKGKLFTSSNTLVYEGEFEGDHLFTRYGYGKFYYSNGDRFEGYFSGTPNYDDGTYYFKNGDKFVGSRNKRYGNGILYHANGAYELAKFDGEKFIKAPEIFQDPIVYDEDDYGASEWRSLTIPQAIAILKKYFTFIEDDPHTEKNYVFSEKGARLIGVRGVEGIVPWKGCDFKVEPDGGSSNLYLWGRYIHVNGLEDHQKTRPFIRIRVYTKSPSEILDAIHTLSVLTKDADVSSLIHLDDPSTALDVLSLNIPLTGTDYNIISDKLDNPSIQNFSEKGINLSFINKDIGLESYSDGDIDKMEAESKSGLIIPWKSIQAISYEEDPLYPGFILKIKGKVLNKQGGVRSNSYSLYIKEETNMPVLMYILNYAWKAYK